MVAAVENLTRLVGTVTAREPHPDRPGWDLVTLLVETAEEVAGKADLLSGRRGEELPLAVPRELLRDTVPGRRLSCRARLTPLGAMAEPHPAEGEFWVDSP